MRFDNGTHGTYNVDWPDVFGISNGGVGAFEYSGLDTANGFAGVYYEGPFPNSVQDGKVIVLGFPFETIYPEETRNNLAKEILNFFDQQTNIAIHDDNERPSSFTLSQNYPNPFNPTTTITYSLPEQSYVSLKIYDALGREVAILVEEEQTPGYFEVMFNASSFASGTYFYRINITHRNKTQENYSDTKKMILLK